jgi:release factor glutamine methyltransferase
VTAAEKSARALARSRKNAEELGLAGRFEFVRVSAPAAVNGEFDLIVSNPPYIPTGVIPGLAPEVLSEPKMALDGGYDGLDVARRLAEAAPSKLKEGGALIMELGEAQAKRMLGLMPDSVWTEKKVYSDLSGIERFAYGRLRQR